MPRGVKTGGRKKTRALPAPRLKPRGVSGPRLSVALRDWVLQRLAENLPPATVAERMRVEQGVAVTRAAIGHLRKKHAVEIAQRRQIWLADFRQQPLANPKHRIEELCRQLLLLARDAYKTRCPRCAGTGVHRPGTQAGRACDVCRGYRWVLSDEFRTWLIGGRDAAGAWGLAALPTPPPHASVALLREMREILRQIAEETGDGARGRQGQPADGGKHLHLHGMTPEHLAELRRIVDEVKALPPAQMVAWYESSEADGGDEKAAVPAVVEEGDGSASAT